MKTFYKLKSTQWARLHWGHALAHECLYRRVPAVAEWDDFYTIDDRELARLYSYVCVCPSTTCHVPRSDFFGYKNDDTLVEPAGVVV